jgi:two-component system chemotaxis response regulator CheB
VVVASSAGGLAALVAVLERLPAQLPAAIVVVQHLERSHPSHLAEILARRTPLAVSEAKQGNALVPGGVHIAPPDRHVVVNADGTLSLSDSAPVNFVRPSADTLFESAAATFGEATIAVVLSGTGRDGAAGVSAVKARGGTVIAQQGAEFDGMPSAAVQTGHVDRCLPLDEIGPALVELIEGPGEERAHAGSGL